MGLIRAPKAKRRRSAFTVGRDSKGIALFMVIAAVSVLSILVVEFTYIAQVSSTIAYDGLDQLKAHYLAKSGFKLSLLRLKAYNQIRSLAGTLGGGGGAMPGATPAATGAAAGAGSAGIPKQLLQQIWSFPFYFPLPTNLPGMSPGDKERIEAFQKDSGLEGKFTAIIESESNKLNLNQILPQFGPSPVPGASASPTPPGQQPAPGQPAAPGQPGAPAAGGAYDATSARQALSDYLTQLFTNKLQSDQEFADEYRDINLPDLIENIIAWADRTIDKEIPTSQETVPFKKAPYYSISELHMVPGMDDKLYDLFAPNLTVSGTTGFDVNTIQEPALRALVPQMTKDEATEFFKFRDATDADNTFNSPDDFFNYLSKSVQAFRSQSVLDQYKADLARRNIQIAVDENQFRITVQAQVNNSVRTIEAYVMLTGTTGAPLRPGQPAQPPQQLPPPQPGQPPGTPQATMPDPGIKITFMRVL